MTQLHTLSSRELADYAETKARTMRPSDEQLVMALVDRLRESPPHSSQNSRWPANRTPRVVSP